MNKYGTLYVVAAPSGCGKTSLVAALIERFKRLQISISYTTRPQRPGEENGVHYHFVTEDKFQAMIQEQDFLEYAQVFNHMYGTSRSWVAEQLDQGTDVILEIDWQGGRQIGQLFHHVKTIFVLPPSLATLRERLEKRQQDSKAVIDQRMDQAIQEMSHFNEFTYMVVNDDFDQALEDLASIVNAERLKSRYQAKNQADLLAKLIEKR